MNSKSDRVGDRVISCIVSPDSKVGSRLTDTLEKVELSEGADKHEVTENNIDQNLEAEHPEEQQVSSEALKIEPDFIGNRIEQLMQLSLESPPVHGQKLRPELIVPGQKEPPENPFILFRPQDLSVVPDHQQLPKNTSIVPEQEQVQKNMSTVLELPTFLESESKVLGQQQLLRKSMIPKKRPYLESASIDFLQQHFSNDMSVVPEQQQFIDNTPVIPDQQHQLKNNTPNIFEQQPYPENVSIISEHQLNTSLENPPEVPGPQPLPRKSIIPKKRQYLDIASVVSSQQQFSKNTSFVPEQQQLPGNTSIISGQQQYLENPPTGLGQQPFQRNTSIIPKKRPHSGTLTVPDQQVLLPIKTVIFPRQQQFPASPSIISKQQQFSKNESNIPGRQQLSASLSMDTEPSSIDTGQQQLAEIFSKHQQLRKYQVIVFPRNLQAPQNNPSEEAKHEMMESNKDNAEKRLGRLISQQNKGEITIIPGTVNSKTYTSKVTATFSAATKTIPSTTTTTTTIQTLFPDPTWVTPVSPTKCTQHHRSSYQYQPTSSTFNFTSNQSNNYQPSNQPIRLKRRLTYSRLLETPSFQQPSSSRLLPISDELSPPLIGSNTETAQPYQYSEKPNSQQHFSMRQGPLSLPISNPNSNYQTQDQLSDQHIIQELGTSNLQSQIDSIKEYTQQSAWKPSIISGFLLENPNNEVEPRQLSD